MCLHSIVNKCQIFCCIEEECRARSPSYRAWLEEQEQMEKFRQEEEERILREQNERWLENERLAKERWEQQQKRLEYIKAEKVKKEVLKAVATIKYIPCIFVQRVINLKFFS